ncbi:glutamyl-tRNA reductase-binding protein, chloroplastic-like [Cucurbita pepo subsp. pepo]|uniref:glutamyl-tRNA reductase-binding protein, chloroplastic-like n=1 Tax=Cucurbita pepo subsp. pepo TaxID=3664 RepID=UPI000C9D7213|nr:glutamyl-tRNA reductase-binding protein, chloroplastic-like [Cucurbita pepo subsp. pepo]
MATVVPHSLTLRFCSRTALNGRIASHFPRSLISSFNPRFRLSFSMAASTESTPQIVASGDANREQIDVSKLIQAHQEKAARFSLSPAEEIRTLMDQRVRGMLSTFSRRFEGYPSGSFVDFACDADGTPILAVSSLAEHAKNLATNPKCSLLVAKEPEDRGTLVVTLHGDAVAVPEEDRLAVRAAYLSKHPNAFWVDFGDFQFVYIKPKVIRYVSGVATASLASGELSGEEYKAAQVDPVAQFSKPITSHMNRDHAEDTKNIVRHWTSIPVDSAIMLDLDSLGFNVEAGYQGSSFKLRVPFPRRAENRKDVKTLVVEMLEAAKPQA